MSLEKKGSDLDQSVCRPKSVEEAVGSHYALQVALQTMKERCQHLQQRLGAVEEENLNLRIEYRKQRSDSVCATAENALQSEPEDSKPKIDCLEEKVIMLTRQKTQLAHHLRMVATENRQLWNRLSHLTQANQNLGSHLSKISSTLSRHHSTNSIVVPKSQLPASSLAHRGELNLLSDNVLTKESCNIANKGAGVDSFKEHSGLLAKTSGDVAEESLEEISLKLIKSFLQEKTELEEQYAQMVEIQSDSSLCSVQNLGFAYMEDGNETIEDMKDHHKKLLELKAMLKEQQMMMKAATANVERIKKGCAVCKPCQEKSEVKPTSEDSDADIESEVENLKKWGIPDGTSYSEDIQRQLAQVAEPPATASGCAVCKPCQEKSEVKPTSEDSDADIESEVESLRKWGKPCQEKSEMKPTSEDSDADIESEVESLRKWGIPDGTSYNEDIQRQLAQVAKLPATASGMIEFSKHKERICPMCCKEYNQGITFETFQQHVLDHFIEEEESYSILNTPEVKT